jgi:hypothetical protein
VVAEFKKRHAEMEMRLGIFGQKAHGLLQGFVAELLSFDHMNRGGLEGGDRVVSLMKL